MAIQIANTRAKEVNQRQFGESCQRTKSVASNEKKPKKLIRGSCRRGQRSQSEAFVGKKPKELTRGSWRKVAKELSQWQAGRGNQRS